MQSEEEVLLALTSSFMKVSGLQSGLGLMQRV